jgi:hypothetical protein
MDELSDRLRRDVPCVGLLSDEELAAILAAIQETHHVVPKDREQWASRTIGEGLFHETRLYQCPVCGNALP